MKITALGHVVVRVTDCARAEAFYGGFLGMPVCARYDENGIKMAFFTLGNHHDFAVSEVSPDANGGPQAGPGLDHVGFRIGDDIDQLREAKAKLDAAGIAISPMDHGVTKSLYFHDPDGNGVELYVDVSEVWRTDPQQVAQAAPLAL
jgi:catechol 2,3-dioxygenase